MHTTTLVIYVIEVDSVAMEYRLPCDKVLMIKSLIGLLSFACSAIVLGRAIPRSVISSTCGHPYCNLFDLWSSLQLYKTYL